MSSPLEAGQTSLKADMYSEAGAQHASGVKALLRGERPCLFDQLF